MGLERISQQLASLGMGFCGIAFSWMETTSLMLWCRLIWKFDNWQFQMKRCQTIMLFLLWSCQQWIQIIFKTEFIKMKCPWVRHLVCGPYWGCAAPKGHFLSPDSLAKGEFLAKIPWPRVYFSPEVLSQGYITKGIFGLKFLKIL